MSKYRALCFQKKVELISPRVKVSIYFQKNQTYSLLNKPKDNINYVLNRMHDETKSLECPTCHKPFARETYLNQHLR